jgi:hypothetical protein
MKHLTWLFCGATALAAFIAALATWPAQANDITTEWATVKPPPAPELKPATVEPKTTALLILDLMKVNCGTRPRCGATVPNVKKLLDAARARDMMVFYTMVGANPKPEGMVDQILAPRDGEWVVRGGADKFIGSDLEQRLKDKGIKTVIVTGTSAQGAVVGTSNVGGRSLQRAIRGLAPLQGRSRRPHGERDAHAQRSDQVRKLSCIQTSTDILDDLVPTLAIAGEKVDEGLWGAAGRLQHQCCGAVAHLGKGEAVVN